MKRRFIAVVILMCIIAVFLAPSVIAADAVCFSVANNTILPLEDATMPKYYGSLLYLPYSFFSTKGLGVYVALGDGKVMLYSSVTKRLTFDVKNMTIYDQDDKYYSPLPKESNGAIYVPVGLVCSYFGLLWDVVKAEPAPIARVTTSDAVNNATFISLSRGQLQAEYDKYTGVASTPSNPGTSAAPSPSVSIEPTYEDVTVYLSFYDLSGGKLKSILDALASTAYKACFFVTADEIKDNADLLRRASCEGHTIGILLTDASIDGAYSEYQNASAILFEAAQVRTVIVTALGDTTKAGDAAAAAESMAKAESLVFWRATKSYDADDKFSITGLTDKLSKLTGSRESLYFACSDKTSAVLRSFLSHLSAYEYSVRRIVETSIPVMKA